MLSGTATRGVVPAEPSPEGTRQRSRFRVLVPVVALLGGLLMASAATTAGGRDLRSQRTDLPQLVSRQQQRVGDLEKQVSDLRGDVEARTQAQASADARVGAATADAARLADPAGLDAVSGPGMTVSLDDAPPAARSRPPAPGLPAPTPDDLVVHQQDIQAVVNALWAGGAEAMTLMGQRVIATTAVRCVGNTLLLHGAVYSPPFVVAAVGDPSQLSAALDEAPGVQVFRQYVDAYGLRLATASQRQLRLPGYSGSVELGVRALP